MVRADGRRQLIVATAGHYFGVSNDIDDDVPLSGNREIEKFLDDESCKTLCAQPRRSEVAGLTLTIDLPSRGGNTLVFFKVASAVVTEKNFHALVQVVSTGGDASSSGVAEANDVSALVNALRLVWAPTLERAGIKRNTLRKLEDDLSGRRRSRSVAEEQLAWEKRARDARSSAERRVAPEVAGVLCRIREELDRVAASRDGLREGAEEALETISGYVDDLWKLEGRVFSEERMRSLLDAIGDEVVSAVEDVVAVQQRDADDGFQAREEEVSSGAVFCEKWVESCHRLTELFWPHQSLHPWKGPVHTPERCAKLGSRLKTMTKIRAQYRQLTRLLTPSERTALGTDGLSGLFEEVRRFGISEDETGWERAKRKVEEALAPAEERVAGKLRAQFSGVKNPSSLAAEFRRYGDLLRRETLRRTLRGERESLLSAVGSLVESYQIGPDTDRLLDTPRVIQEIQAARAAELQLEGLGALAKELLADLPGYDDAVARINSALRDTASRRRDLVESWTNETRSAIAAKELTLDVDGAVVALTGTSLMRVTYHPRLTQLVREVRALAGQGVELPREIRDLAEKAAALAGRARSLQQVATFHNTIGDRMVPSQRPLMLVAALELARAVREQSGVAWNDLQRVDAYTARLRELVRKFARQNAELSVKHAALGEQVGSLLRGKAVSLVSNQNGWKETLRNMRSIVDAVEAEYGNTKAWKLHWDRQLLKALGVSYRAALPSILRKLPELRAELVFREGRLQWRPPLEEIRAKLYASLRRFLSIPLNFRGVGDISEGQFGSLVPRNAYLYGRVYSEAEIVLRALETARVKWIPLAAPTKIEVGERLRGRPPQEWEKAFKDAKQWAQEIGKLRGSEFKLCCIVVETGTARRDLETTTRRSWERLAADLRAEASSRLVAVTEFLSSTSEELDRRPRSVEEIGMARETYARLCTEATGIAEELESVGGLARVLAAWTREHLDGVYGARAVWDGLAERFEKHRLVMDKQLEDAKLNLRHRYAVMRDDWERWETRWASRPDIVDSDWIAATRERWAALVSLKKSIDEDREKLGLALAEVTDDATSAEFSTAEVECELEALEMDCRVQAIFMEELSKQVSEEWTVARRRLPRFHDWLDSWGARVRGQSSEVAEKTEQQESKTRDRGTFVEKKIRELRYAVETVQILRSDDLVDEHWAELGPILGLPTRQLRDVTFGHLLSAARVLEEKMDEVKVVTKKAAAESGIRQALIELESWEGATALPLQIVKDSKQSSLQVVADYAGLLARAGELTLLLEGARGSSTYERFAARAGRWEAALSELEERIKLLSAIQRKWIYLEPIFGGGVNLSEQNAVAKWVGADKEFRYLMAEIGRDPRVPSLRRLPLPSLVDLKNTLDRCQRSLDEFLEEKRAAYPRLYFLSDEDLLELVSGSRGLDAHLPKLYPGIGGAVTDENRLTGVLSPEGELLKLSRVIDLTDPLPKWLGDLESAIREALQLSLDECLADSNVDPSRYPAQILLLSERIRFTERCEKAMRESSKALRNFIEDLEAQRAKYRVFEDAGDRLTVLKARGLLLEVVHHLGMVRTLAASENNSIIGNRIPWDWARQLRTYRSTTPGDGPIVRCAGAEFPYRFEYQGAGVGLVRTPLTERCFLALTQAMKLGLGGSPTGPAGTGKTESVKALGAILGRLVLVFNCDEGMDAGSVRRILGGLAQAGAWGCFDEFNRLKEETLSAVSMLIGPLQEAVRDGADHVQLGVGKVTLDPYCCIFITMNPAGIEYGGRNKLPDSLARLFRPVAMAHPDRLDIAGTSLECAGFLEARSLAKQLVETLDLSEKLLSRQPHYDWGLRTLRSVLEVVQRQSGKQSATEGDRLSDGLRVAVVPKLIETDATKFFAVLADVFPKVKHQEQSEPTEGTSKALYTSLEAVGSATGLGKEIIHRCVQLEQQLQARTGVAIVGPPGCGKTTLRRTLAGALARLGTPVTQFLVYPGAVAKSTLLGYVDSRTREWKEGILSGTVASAGDTPTWIILDGDVAPGWAEALNSALDDNRLLTLPNGVGVRLGSATRFIFETHQLDDASPATVSRLGVVYLGTTAASALLSESRLALLPPEATEIALTHLPTGIDAVLRSYRQRSSASGLISATLAHLETARTRTMAAHGLCRSLCGGIENDRIRDRFARLVYEWTGVRCSDRNKASAALYDADMDRLEVAVSTSDYIEIDEGPLSLSGSMKIALAALKPWIKSGHPVLLRGPPGCGKSSIVAAALSSAQDSRNGISIVRGSSLHGPEELITRLKRACVQQVDSSTAYGRTYRPRGGRSLILLLEDIHLATMDLQEQTRQLLQEGGFHDDDLEFAQLPLTVICTADGQTPIHARLEALLATHHIPLPTSEELLAMLDLHVKVALKQYGTEDDRDAGSWISRMSTVMLEAYGTFAGIGDDPEWSARDLMTWADALESYPIPESPTEAVRHAMNAGQRIFFSRLDEKKRSRWEATLLTKYPEARGTSDDVFALQSGNATSLVPLNAEQWRQEVEAAVVKCVREGQTIETTVTSQFLHLVAGTSWALGRGYGTHGQRGLLLTGRPGAGRRAATMLAAAQASFQFIDAAPGRARLAIKAAVQAAGVQGEPTLLLLEEHHVREEGIVVLIASLLDRGEMPGLMTPEELDGMIAPLGELARTEDFFGTLEQYLQYRLRGLLRVALIVNEEEIGEEWIRRSGLLRHCVVVGCDHWWTSEVGLAELATRRCEDSDSETEALVVAAQLSVPDPQQLTPASFLALLHAYESLRREWTENVEQELASLEAGIGRLRDAGERVAKLQEEATTQREQLEAEKGKAASALEQIAATMRGATGQREEMTTLKAETERESIEVARRKADIEAELGKVEPLVAEAAQAVAGIGQEALAEVRSLRAPPAPVRDVLEGVLKLMGIRDTSWNSMKTFLAKRGIKDEIRTWDARRSSASSLEAVEKLVKDRAESFEEKTAKRVSVAAAPLAAWVLANLRYGQVLRDVVPLEREQRILAERLVTAQAQLDRLATGLNSVEGRVSQLQQDLATHSRGVAALQLQVEKTGASLAAAQGLLVGLEAEHRDWDEQHRHLTERKTRLAGEAVTAAALLVHQLGNGSPSLDRDTIDLLVSERERLSWRAQGLPVDSNSLVGAVRALKGPLVPLFLDPSGVAVIWLKTNLASAHLETTRPTDPKFLTTLELAVRFGKPLLIEEIGVLPAVLLPLLQRRPLRLGDRSLTAQPGFKLFLATRRESLELGKELPREAVVASVVLGTGRGSISETLIERALLRETPELEEARRTALERAERLAGERDEARIDLLKQLGAAKGQDLLGEQGSGGLLATLEATQAKAKEIARALDENRRSLQEVTRRAGEHSALANFAAGLYEAIRDLPRLAPLYVFSTDEFTEIYLRALLHSGDGDVKIDEGKSANEVKKQRLVAMTLQHCARAAYRKHRLALALHLVLSSDEKLPIGEKNYLLRENDVSSHDGIGVAATIPDWVPEERRSAVATLITANPQLGDKLRRDWLNNAEKILSDAALTPLQKMLVVRALSPDHLYAALSKIAASQLGVRDIAPPTLSLVNDNFGGRPVLLLLSPGADPGQELRTLASSTGTSFVEVSLGQDQLTQAEAALEQTCIDGGWVLLSNLQLALNWLPKLESLLRSAACNASRNPNSRIWLTTEECTSGFYPGLSALCTKIAYEPPEGVKRNVKRCLQQLRQQRKNIDATEALMLAWLHATLQERRRFVPQGWIKEYEWSETDLEAGAKLVTGNDGKTDWEAGRGLLDVAVYGGRLQDAYDARVLRGMLADVWSGDVFDGRCDLGGVLSVRDSPSREDISRILRKVDRLPDHDAPREYFGLPANVGRAWERAAAESALRLLRDMEGKTFGDHRIKTDRAKDVQKTAVPEELDDESIEQMDFLEARNTQRSATNKRFTNEDPLREFFTEERDVGRALSTIVERRINTEESRLADSPTPKDWLEVWSTGPATTLHFARRLPARQRALDVMNDKATTVDLAYLGRPQAFLAALKQRTARSTKQPIEELRLRVDWSGNKGEDSDEGWRYGITLEGLLITGAAIRNGQLVEVEADEPPITSAPRCRLSYWTEHPFDDSNSRRHSTSRNINCHIEVPIYTNLNRNHLISALPVPCAREQADTWLRRGVSFHVTSN